MMKVAPNWCGSTVFLHFINNWKLGVILNNRIYLLI